MLSSVFNGALRWGWCKRNPCLGVRRNPEKRRERFLLDGEIALVRTAAGPQVQCIMDLVLLTALRKADVLKIKLRDWTPEGLRVEVQKTGRVLIFEKTPALEGVWNRARKLRRRVGSLSLFCTRTGQAYTTSGFDSIWRRTLQRAGVKDFRFHDLRARALTDAQKQFGLEYAQLLAAHVNITTTERYIRDRRSKIVRPLK